MGDELAFVTDSDPQSQLQQARREERLLWAVTALARRSSGRLGMEEIDAAFAVGPGRARGRLSGAIPCRRSHPPVGEMAVEVQDATPKG